MRFKGKRTVVTGGARGIGRVVVETLLADGASVVVCDIDEDEARRATDEFGTPKAIPVGGDVARRDDVRKAIDLCVASFGGIDVMVAHAGIADVEPLLEIGDKSWQRMFDVNVTGVFFCVQEAARAMGDSGGAIVVTGSTNAFWVESNTSHYNASKGAVIAFVRSAALDLAPRRIRVNAVDPGLIRTRLTTYVTEITENAADYLMRIPLARFGEPVDVANAIVFLASEDAAWITGQEIVVDGGQTLGTPLPIPAVPLPASVRAGQAREQR